MTEIGVKATYTGPPLFLASGQCQHVLSSLKDHLPLRSLHWKSTSRTAIRSIQELPVEFVLLDTVKDERSYQMASKILEKPLVNIYFVTCEDADVYKNTVRKQIKDWHATISQRKNQEWMIVLISRPDVQATTNRLFQRGTIIDKIRADFNVAKRDRCVQLAWAVGSEDPAAWTDFVSKLKDGIVSSFDTSVVAREEEVKRSESQRQMVGWNFCVFFMLKESLALAFESVNLLEDALIVYEELEALFFLVLKERRSGSWFGELGGTAPGDDSAPLLSTIKKPYSDLILSNTITMFDFRSYLLARICYIKSRLGRIADAAATAARFITSFARTLRENEEFLSDNFLESWIYSSAFNVVNQCQAWVEALPDQLDSASLNSFNAVKGELLELARNQLDKIGLRLSYLPLTPPFSFASRSSTRNPLASPPTPSQMGPPISQQDLLDAISDQAKFDQLYVTTTNRAIQTYTSCGRKRLALKLHTSLAALELHRKRYANAYNTFSSLPAHYAVSKWTSLEAFMLSNSLLCHRLLNKPKDSEYVTHALAFLKAFVTGCALQYDEFAGLYGQERTQYVRDLLKGIKEAGPGLENEYISRSHPAFSIQLKEEEARCCMNEDGSLVDIVVRNCLPCIGSIDSIELTFVGDDPHDQIVYSTLSPACLSPGDNTMTLLCPASTSGLYILSSSVIRFSKKIVFSYSHIPSKPHRHHHHHHHHHHHSQRHIILRVPRDSASLDIEVGFPRKVVLNETPHLLVKFSSGRNQIRHAELTFKTPGDEIYYETAKAKVVNEEESLEIECKDGQIIIKNAPPSKVLSLNLPYGGARVESIKVIALVSYTSESEQPRTRNLRRVRQVNTALPVAVNVQDYFRGKCLFSKFRISCATEQPLRLASALLEHASSSEFSDLSIRGFERDPRAIETVTPSRPAHYIFKIESSATKPRNEREMLSLTLRYRTLREDIEALVTQAVKMQASRDPSLIEHKAWLWNVVMTRIESTEGWLDNYAENPVILLNGEEKGWDEAFASGIRADDPVRPKLFVSLNAIDKMLGDGLELNTKEDDSTPNEESRTEWRILSIPLDLPFLNILSSASIAIPSLSKLDASPVYAGQPISAVLTIKTSFHWGARGEAEAIDEGGYTLRFDVNSDVGLSWLISGHKKGEFFAKDDSTYETHLTLVPLRHGQLLLPKVVVTPVAKEPQIDDSESTAGTIQRLDLPTCETHQAHFAQRVLVLPRSARSTYIVPVEAP
ncbi:hypothetical protein FRC03_004988 [Tulasnella sp. 419]|nr:hypothetical protein FRC03_004988 [Tulasnella sp. 419]